jgi:hypothetical protein
MKRFLVLSVVIAVAATVIGCGDDEHQIIGECFECKCNPEICGRDLSSREDVLQLMEAAYNTRNADYYDALLDNNFHFYFTEGDAAGGMPQLWDRATELTTVSSLLIEYPSHRSTHLDIRTEEGIVWTEFNPASSPTETWYSATLYYEFWLEVPPDTYISPPGARAVFTVRDAGPAGDYAHHWQLVEMHDLGASSVNAASSSATQPVTWGYVKALFVEDGCLSCVCNPAMCPSDHNLAVKDHVLKNIEDAYNQRRIDLYDALLDPSFTFFFGDQNFDQWDRTTEKDVNTKLLDVNYAPLPAQSISLDIVTGNKVTWTEITPASAPSERWFQATLFYDFDIEIAPNTYIPEPGSKAVFTIRDTGPDDEYAHHWQLVEMRDLGGLSRQALSAASEVSSWAKVKGLYR